MAESSPPLPMSSWCVTRRLLRAKNYLRVSLSVDLWRSVTIIRVALLIFMFRIVKNDCWDINLDVGSGGVRARGDFIPSEAGATTISTLAITRPRRVT